MLEGENIIIFSSADWKIGPTSPQHISTNFAEKNKVLFVETFGSRVPALERDHLKRIKQRLLNWPKGIRHLSIDKIKIYIYSPIILLTNFTYLLPLNRFIYLNLMKHLIKKLDMKNPILYFYLPPPTGTVGTLNEKAIIYHLVDDWRTFPGGKNKLFLEAEKILLKNADLVLAANQHLYDIAKPFAHRIYKLYHGVDYNHFAKKISNGDPLPEDIKNIPRPIIAIVGAFADWMDLDLIKLIAQTHREWSIISIGTRESNVKVNELESMANVHFLGQKNYSELPNYYRAVDAFIIPFLLTEHIKTCAPTRLYEHLSSGKPIITTDFPAAREVGEGLIDIALSREDFVEKTEMALRENNPSLIQRRRALAKRNTWKARVEEISAIIEDIFLKKVSLNA